MSNNAGETRRFDPGEVEPKWQAAWDEADVFHVDDEATDPSYVLAMFPYPSGEMHMGHVRNYAITDAYARYRRMQGDAVLHPMGWDSFGLPAENAANERDVDPREWTMDCIDRMRSQMELLGLGFDWDREVTTCEPEYYRWNQWIFLQCYEAGLVERQSAELNWCPDCETVLADENVNAHPDHPRGICWRCDSPIEYRDLDQWFFTITDYAEELYDTLEEMGGWPENVREMQRNWIGKQEGTTVEFELTTGDSVDIFTTRLDTIYGATFFALAPGHEIAGQLAGANDEVAAYIERAKRAEELPETSGVFTGEYATNPATGEQIPVYVADYVLEDIGTGALYAVPAHDERDHAFAQEHDIGIRQVVEPTPESDHDPEDIDVETAAYTEDGVLVNSGPHDGLSSPEARERFVERFDGAFQTAHSLRDWCISRQRYWGTPIPFVHCDSCGYVPVPESELPVELPEFVQTTGNPLDAAEEWKQVRCPECGGEAVRETDTMDTFVDSSWYFLRYISPELESAPFDERASEWLPVDQYVGGIEHATMHLIYSRFVTKALEDLGLLDGVREPFENLLTQGMVRKSGEAMSSSTGNVVSPRPFVHAYGSDTGRLFMLNAAQPEKDFDWTDEGARSAHEFLQNVYGLATSYAAGEIETGEGGAIDEYVTREIDAVAATATAEFEAFRFNHALQEVRELVALLRRYADHTDPRAETFERGLATVTKLLAPVAPHTAEEVWDQLGREGLVATADWPTTDSPEGYETARLLVENTREDVRDIVSVADIENPERIEIAVAPEWKHYARQRARELDGNVVSQLMGDTRLQTHGEDAADYAKQLAGAGHLDEQLPPEREQAVLSRAAWLLEREFDATVVVHGPDEAAADLAGKATPGRPGIRIEESSQPS